MEYVRDDWKVQEILKIHYNKWYTAINPPQNTSPHLKHIPSFWSTSEAVPEEVFCECLYKSMI